ncbi:hypothetical protein ACFOHK_11040 [Falsigemmobacter intermedius]|uniref:DUF2946 domain-containing protein n=1 Tax=Falsigemmobacter intermedius TaxID=1553448 RepID=A0A444MG57_9RHOB|nr:hypothetical protein [Falsigemmobacter intermedius]RWY44675.1 hypothetical protein EP867_01705 [Falsigemmobacter intermedius]
MTPALRLLRFLPLLALPALFLALMAGPRHIAPSLMEAQIAEAIMMGATPDDLCGMEDGSAAPCHACLPQTAWDLAGPAQAGAAPLPRLLGALATRVAVTPVQPRMSGPGAIRDPPSGKRLV